MKTQRCGSYCSLGVKQTHCLVGLHIPLLGGASDPGERLGIYVEREAWLRPYLPLKPGHRTEGRCPRQAAPAEQGEFNVCKETPYVCFHTCVLLGFGVTFKAQDLHCVWLFKIKLARISRVPLNRLRTF